MLPCGRVIIVIINHWRECHEFQDADLEGHRPLHSKNNFLETRKPRQNVFQTQKIFSRFSCFKKTFLILSKIILGSVGEWKHDSSRSYIFLVYRLRATHLKFGLERVHILKGRVSNNPIVTSCPPKWQWCHPLTGSNAKNFFFLIVVWIGLAG